MIYQKMQTAHDWGYKPSELGICDQENDLDYMTAFTNTKSRMATWEDHDREVNRPPKKSVAGRK